MAAYMGQRIIDGIYTYDYVISRRPDLKAGIDAYLASKGREDLITRQGYYMKHKEPTTEKLIEDLFDEHDIYWEKTET